jgi:hypothetical protein
MFQKKYIAVILIAAALTGIATVFFINSKEIVTKNTNENEFGIYLSISENGDDFCNFSDATGCRLTYIEIGKNGSIFRPVKNSVEHILEDVSIIAAAVNPSETWIAFMAAESSGDWEMGHLYAYSLETKEVRDITSGVTIDDNGRWANWINDSELLYTNNKECGRDCSREGKNFSTLFRYDLETGKTEKVLGDEYDNCDINDVFISSSGMISGHSETSAETFDDDCPLTRNVTQANQGKDYGPQPWVLNLKDGIYEFISFDMEEAGINACAHFATNDDIWICTEQNNLDSYKLCSDKEKSLTECRSSGDSVIVYNRLFGWSLNKSGDEFESVRGDEPLFDHLHPSELPEVERYWDSEDENCQVYKTKQAQIIGDTVVAHIYCQSADNEATKSKDKHITHFSRIFLIDIQNPDSPGYFDLTSWFEDEFENWDAGEASSFTSAIFGN